MRLFTCQQNNHKHVGGFNLFKLKRAFVKKGTVGYIVKHLQASCFLPPPHPKGRGLGGARTAVLKMCLEQNYIFFYKLQRESEQDQRFSKSGNLPEREGFQMKPVDRRSPNRGTLYILQECYDQLHIGKPLRPLFSPPYIIHLWFIKAKYSNH